MGSAVVDTTKWTLVIDGLVKRTIVLSLHDLYQLPRKSVTAFHECYGPPTKPPIDALWRVGNVVWTGVALSELLSMACPLPEAEYLWSEGLDYGSFAGVSADSYQKDLPIEKAISQEVLLAFEMNGEPLTKERGGPVRLVVPGWFGTNMTKWLCRLSLRKERAPGPFTTTFYNELDPEDPTGKTMRPVWMVEVNSMIVRPAPGSEISGPKIKVEGWAWCCEPVSGVEVTVDSSGKKYQSDVSPRTDFSWQRWKVELYLSPGMHIVTARAKSISGMVQPLSGRRNHVHSVQIHVLN
jgi:DMSO/TMAO reductase YedYZ molybdopterin-dependent catalytic subunit